MCILLLLNSAQAVSFAEIMQSLSPLREEAESALLSLTAELHPLLLAEPALHGARFEDTTNFRINSAFKPTSSTVVVRSVQVQDDARSKDDVSAILYVERKRLG